MTDGTSISDRGHATIRDVAARAGVSTATVSRVLAGIGRSRPHTAAAVERAAMELGYRPSGVARSLRMRRTRTLGLIVTDIQNPFFPELVQAADVAARSFGYSILLGSAAWDEERATHYLDLMADRRVDGLIIASSQLSQRTWDWLGRAPVPIVVANAETPELPVDVILSDNVCGGEMAAEHLLALGHRRIAYIAGSADLTASAPRLAGFSRRCEAAGLDPTSFPIFTGDARVEGGERATREIVETRPDVTAIACHNDLTAIGAMRALRAAGIRVPFEMSVVGCDDIAATSWVYPSLTTVAQQKAEMGRLAVERLIARLEGPETAPPPEVTRLAMVLRVRESTAPPPSRDETRSGETAHHVTTGAGDR